MNMKVRTVELKRVRRDPLVHTRVTLHLTARWKVKTMGLKQGCEETVVPVVHTVGSPQHQKHQ